jgi:hypothetical protein
MTIEHEHYMLDFRTGEVRKISREENARLAMEQQKRQKVKDGVVYIDCEPPGDDASER